MKRTYRHILSAMKRGEPLWRHTSRRRAWVGMANGWRTLRLATVEDMMEAGLIEEDRERSIYREHGSDIHYCLTTMGNDLAH